MNWDWGYAVSILPALLSGVWQTILVTFASAAIALGGGLLIAVLASLSGKPGLVIIRCLVEMCRGVPILVALYFGFYALPLLGITLPPFFVGVAILGVIYAAYSSEVYRGALVSIPRGVHDACHALGLSPFTTWTRILIPMAVRNSVPALINYVLILYRQSAFLFAIGVPVLLAEAQIAGNQSFRYLEPYTLAGLLYLVLNIPFLFLLQRYGRTHVAKHS